MTVETKPLTEIPQDALRLLYRELGLVNTIRLLNQFTARLWELYSKIARTNRKVLELWLF